MDFPDSKIQPICHKALLDWFSLQSRISFGLEFSTSTKYPNHYRAIRTNCGAMNTCYNTSADKSSVLNTFELDEFEYMVGLKARTG